MPHFHKTLTFIAVMAMASAAVAQDDAVTDADDLSLGREVVEPTYIKEQYEDWQLKCFRSEAEEDPCQMFQLINGEDGNPVAQISLFRLPEGNPAEAGATITVPLATLLTEEVQIRIDDGKAKSYPYTLCSQVGCFAQIGFTEDDVDSLKKGETAMLTVVHAQAPGRPINIPVSLRGFTAAYDNVSVAQR